jgi:hypothetical protein
MLRALNMGPAFALQNALLGHRTKFRDVLHGAEREIRTPYLVLTKDVLIRMSLQGAEPTLGHDPRTYRLRSDCAATCARKALRWSACAAVHGCLSDTAKRQVGLMQQSPEPPAGHDPATAGLQNRCSAN